MAAINLDFAYPAVIPPGNASTTIDAADEYIAYCITIPRTGTLKKIGWVVISVSSPSGIDLYVALETVAETVGAPVAATRATATLYATGAESARITDPSAGSLWTPINGTTGISVTRGDKVAVTIRCTARTSGSLALILNQYASITYGPAATSYPYTTRDGEVVGFTPAVALQYDDGIVPVAGASNAGKYENHAYNSSSNPDRRGMAFRFPDFAAKAGGLYLLADSDQDFDIIIYDYDEYTVMSGFPLRFKGNQRRTSASGMICIEFTAEVTFVKNQWYRVVLLPTTTTPNVSIYTALFLDDGSFLGIDATPEGANCIYTSRNGAPSSGDHAWTDDDNARPMLALHVVSIDPGSSGSGGGLPILGGSVVR